jgi:hypothetical protein
LIEVIAQDVEKLMFQCVFSILKRDNVGHILSKQYGTPNVALNASAADAMTFESIGFGLIGIPDIDTAFSSEALYSGSPLDDGNHLLDPYVE